MSMDGPGAPDAGGPPPRSTPIDAVIAGETTSAVVDAAVGTSAIAPADVATKPLGKPFRGGNYSFTAVLISGMLVLTSSYGLSILTSGRKQADGSSQPAGVIIGFIAYFVLALFFTWRMARAKVLLGEEGLTVVNIVRTRRIPWADVNAVTVVKRRVKSTYVGKVVINTVHGDVRATAGTIYWSKHEQKLAPLQDACTAHGKRLFVQ